MSIMTYEEKATEIIKNSMGEFIPTHQSSGYDAIKKKR